MSQVRHFIHYHPLAAAVIWFTVLGSIVWVVTAGPLP